MKRSPGDPRVEALVRHTVRHVLFTPLQAEPREKEETTAVPAPEPAAPPSYNAVDHQRVLGYATWSDAELKKEKKLLKARLRAVLANGVADDALSDADAAVAEAYALLQLFMSQRPGQLHTKPPSKRLLHAQLALYAQYFTKVHGHEIQSAEDIASIQAAYELFLGRHAMHSAVLP